MFSTARKLGVTCCILTAINIAGLVMVALLVFGQGLPFSWIFALLMYLISVTVIGLLLTLGIRSIVQDSELESESTAIQIKKLRERIEVLEGKQK